MSRPLTEAKFHNLFLLLISSILLILAFPKIEMWMCAWFGLVPLMFALDGKNALGSFLRAYVCGVFLFTATFYWIGYVTILGAVLMVLYLSIYFGLFGIFYCLFSKRSSFLKLIFLPSAWVCLEYLRGNLLSGFGWASLAHSQYKNLLVIQIADITGMYGVSFLIVMINVFIKESFSKILKRNFSSIKERIWGVFFVFGLNVLVLGYGIFHLNEKNSPYEVSIAVIQGNIGQAMKWNETFWPQIMEQYQDLSMQAAQLQPDLIIWPETSFPGYIGEHHDMFSDLKNFTRTLKVPLLIGSIVKEGGDYYNSAVLISKDGEIVERYDKVHLVPFGEYIPFRGVFPFLEDIIPIEDFSSGKKHTVFSLSNVQAATFSVLICFEDTVFGLARKFVQQGANLIVNITNDAWFYDTKEPYLHLQSSVFRAVEHRRSVVRAANTGISSFIDQKGRVVQSVKDHRGKMTYISGWARQDVGLHNENSLYTKFGDIFAFLCFGFTLGGIGVHLIPKSS